MAQTQGSQLQDYGTFFGFHESDPFAAPNHERPAPGFPPSSGSPLEPANGLQPAIPTVATKLRIPPAPQYLIQRNRLLDVLDEGIGKHLTLLSAPAGAGKTVLLASWVQQRTPPGPVCWLSLDGDDNDASRLLTDLLSALRNSQAIKPNSVLACLAPPVGARTEQFLPLLVNGLSELSTPVVLMLDEIHELTSPQATDTIDFLVRYAPEQCRLVLAGRADPPLSIERLRLSDDLTELRGAELAFDRDETADFCRRIELDLPATDIDLLWTRTEGWAAALRLAAFSLRNHPEPGRFLAELAGTDHAIADYLIAEVLARLPESKREFMLRTCVVDLVSPELADSLTGLEGSALTLAALEHSGAPLQVTEESEEQHWYRYHPLFRELLRAHLRHTHPEEVPYLHRRAARWYADEGQTMSAIQHALAGEDWEHAGNLIAENWLELFLSGRLTRVHGPMAQLPADIVAADPRLIAASAGNSLQEGELDDAQHDLKVARHTRQQASEQVREQLELTLATVSLYHARLRTNLRDAERLAHKLTALSRSSSPMSWSALHSFALANLGATRLWSGDSDGAREELEEGLALAIEHHYEQTTLDCWAQLAVVHLVRGELTRARDLSALAIELAEQRGWYEGPAVACAYLASAADAYQRGEFERAEGLLAHAASAATTAEASVRFATGALQALVLAAAGPRSAARGVLKLRALRATMAEEAPVAEFLKVAIEGIEVRVLMAAEEFEQASATLTSASEQMPEQAELLVRRASIELNAGRVEEAAAPLARVLSDQHAPLTVHPATTIEAWLLSALVEHERGDQSAAADALDHALALAEHEPYRDAFLLNGPTLRELLERQAQMGTAHPALLEILLDGVGPPSRTGATLAQPLTEREQRILRYLPTMLSNAEIGAEVFVSLNTVKTHLRSIYRKLNANGRADAVDRARELGLLPSGIKRPRVVRR